MDDDPEILQNNINYRITQSQTALENYNYYEAENNLDEALELAEKLKNKKSEGIIYTLKGRLQLLTEEPDNAIKSLNKAVEIQRITKDDANLANSYKTLAEVYARKKDYSQASDYFKSAKNLFQQEGLDLGLTETLLAEGKTYMQVKNYRKARPILEQCLVQAKKIGSLKIQSDALISNGIVYNKLGDNEKALIYANEGLQIAKANNFTNIINTGYLVVSDINESIGINNASLENIKLSRDYLKLHIDLSDSLRNLRTSYSSKDQELQNLTKEMDLKIKEFEEQKEKAEEDSGVRTLTSILSVALITILSLLTLSLYKNNNIRLKSNNMLHKKNGELIIAKEKAELASKTKANFLSTVTHELRTPLYAVTGLSNMLLEENPKPEQIQHLKSLKFSGDYLLTFINDILQINKIEANKVEIEPESFNLKKKINNIVLALNNSANDNNIKIHFEFDKDLPENYIADQLKISQILINLIGNSIKFTKDGDIWIRVYKINQKGKIYVKSELGKGTTFYFEIPLEYTSVKEATENKVTYFEGNKKDVDLTNVKILVVEDNKINQMITKKILTKMNLKCDIIDNGEDAVDMIKANNYDIILMDIHMPGISGIEATKRVRVFDKKLSIFALTAVTIEDKMHEFDEAGFTDIIPKPFRQEEFEKKLYNALAKKNNKSA